MITVKRHLVVQYFDGNFAVLDTTTTEHEKCSNYATARRLADERNNVVRSNNSLTNRRGF